MAGRHGPRPADRGYCDQGSSACVPQLPFLGALASAFGNGTIVFLYQGGRISRSHGDSCIQWPSGTGQSSFVVRFALALFACKEKRQTSCRSLGPIGHVDGKFQQAHNQLCDGAPVAAEGPTRCGLFGRHFLKSEMGGRPFGIPPKSLRRDADRRCRPESATGDTHPAPGSAWEGARVAAGPLSRHAGMQSVKIAHPRLTERVGRRS